MIGKLVGIGLAALIVLGAYSGASYFEQHQQTVTVQRAYIDNSANVKLTETEG